MVKIGMVSLGCPKNQVDAEIMLSLLQEGGYEITADENEAQAIIVNTCGFIADAKQEAIDNIIELGELKKNGSLKAIIVTGCMAQRYRDEILKELPEVDAVVGIGENKNICDIVSKALGGCPYSPFSDRENLMMNGDRLLTSPSYTAYLRIADGCDNKCTYCAIPMIRGKFRSREMENIIAEAKNLAGNGAKEIILIAQDTTRYGEDLYGEYKLPQLLDELQKIDGIEWIRLMYCYEDRITDELIEVMAEEPKICKYIDIPIQHSSDDVLKAMLRRSTEDSIRNTIARLKARIPDIHIRTTLIVGFPGETDEDYEKLLEFVEEMRFARLGVFAYSQEENTVAGEMQDQIDEEIKEERLTGIMRAQLEISLESNKEKIGKTFKVLVEEHDEDGSYIGRTEFDAPEIDNSVLFTSHRQLNPGDFVDVLIEDAFDYDLVGTEV